MFVIFYKSQQQTNKGKLIMKVKAILLLSLMVPMGCATVNVTPDAYRLNNANHKVTSVVSDDFTTVVNRSKTMLKECYPQAAKTVIEGGSFLDVFTNSIEQKDPKTISIIRERAYDYKTMGFIPTGKGKVPVFANTGVTLETVKDILSLADGCIVGTHFKVDGVTWNSVDGDRVKRFMDRVNSL